MKNFGIFAMTLAILLLFVGCQTEKHVEKEVGYVEKAKSVVDDLNNLH